MILEILKEENVQILDSVDTWEEAILVSLQSLVEQGYVTEEYGKSIVKITHEMGPYYVLTENVALVHGRPDSGVLKKQMAVTVLRNPIRFSEDGHGVRLLIALAVTDSESHLAVIKTLAELFVSEIAVNYIVNAENEKQVYEYLLEFDRKAQEND